MFAKLGKWASKISGEKEKENKTKQSSRLWAKGIKPMDKNLQEKLRSGTAFKLKLVIRGDRGTGKSSKHVCSLTPTVGLFPKLVYYDGLFECSSPPAPARRKLSRGAP